MKVVHIKNTSSKDAPPLPKIAQVTSKKTTKRGEGGQKSPILRLHSLWTAAKQIDWYVIILVASTATSTMLL